MKKSIFRREVLTLGSVVGMGALAGCQGLVSGPTPDESNDGKPDNDGESLGLAYGKSGPSPPSNEEVHSGWVHIVSDGESADLTFDIQFCGEFGDVDPELSDAVGDEYVLRFKTAADIEVATSSAKSGDEPPCDTVSRLNGGANVPSDWETLTVEVNNVQIQAIERSGTMPELRPLPDPVRPV